MTVYSIPITLSYNVSNRALTSLSGSVTEFNNNKSISSNDSKGIQVRNNDIYTLSFTLQVNGYDPRLEKPLRANAEFKGGIPSNTQQLQIPGQIGYFSEDMLSFGIVPQYSVSHRMALLRNLADHDIDFSFNDKTSYLLSLGTEIIVYYYLIVIIILGLVSVFPLTGRIERGQHAMINVTVNAKNTCAFSFNDRIKVTLKECIPAIRRRCHPLFIIL